MSFMPLLVRTWNVFHGNAVPPERRAFLRRMVELVSRDADVVCLQELPVWALRRLEAWSGMRAVVAVARRPRVVSAELGRVLTGFHHGLLRSALTGEGLAILVARRFRVSDERTHVVSDPGLRRIVHGLRLDDDVFVANVHITGVPEQLERVAAFVAGEPRAILAGDLNVRSAGPPGFSEPLAGSIDQILVRDLPATPPTAWPEERRRADGRLLSDHAPVELHVG